MATTTFGEEGHGIVFFHRRHEVNHANHGRQAEEERNEE
jgi:hypothetical protein